MTAGQCAHPRAADVRDPTSLRLRPGAQRALDPAGVAAFYTDVASTFLLDRADLPHLPAVEKQGLRAIPTDTLLHQGADPAPLITALLARR
ncbi:hypothetical protein FE633_01725 [Streptomyces montanus]|uniref:Uncharacterized protein n=1 Tax=Streptomyces montanus TaxID=2580423 RepID=A0A5R9FW84_9ACTN|nr:hypothetical protein [Streptomyces montanus]TLS47721.1 hypothetical protein FE633_01725 [Streptomyces montanus]